MVRVGKDVKDHLVPTPLPSTETWTFGQFCGAITYKIYIILCGYWE